MHEGVEALVGLFLSLVREVKGDHRGFELGVPQVTLDEPGIDARFQQMGGVGMPQRMDGMATPIVVIPARCVALRKAPWTLLRLMGAVAVGLCW